LEFCNSCSPLPPALIGNPCLHAILNRTFGFLAKLRIGIRRAGRTVCPQPVSPSSEFVGPILLRVDIIDKRSVTGTEIVVELNAVQPELRFRGPIPNAFCDAQEHRNSRHSGANPRKIRARKNAEATPAAHCRAQTNRIVKDSRILYRSPVKLLIVTLLKLRIEVFTVHLIDSCYGSGRRSHNTRCIHRRTISKINHCRRYAQDLLWSSLCIGGDRHGIGGGRQGPAMIALRLRLLQLSWSFATVPA